ncbi:MAG TPA: FkbM family methyltransferase [Cyclobacteriaceae bacterium]|nr:FkbM family methyltransferase [Cyclobacteriaceae bacterium]
MKSYSQYRQDEVLMEIVFNHNRGGVFLDIGANDGVTYSNTYLMEKLYGWTGVCVEPLPRAFEKLSASRNCKLDQCAIGSKSRVDVFLEIDGYSEMLSGIKRNYDKKHLDRIENEIGRHGGNSREISVRTKGIDDLLRDHELTSINYCNIDTEGSEFEILMAFPFSRCNVDVITVEGNYMIDRWKIRLWLMLRGFVYVADLGGDMLFVCRRVTNALGGKAVVRKKIDTLIASIL